MGDTPQDEGVGALPDCEADRVALGLNDPTGRGASFATGQATSCECDQYSYQSDKVAAGPSYSAAASRSLPASTPEDAVASSLERSRTELENFNRSQASLLQSRAPGKRRRRQEDLVGEEEEEEEDNAEAGPAVISNAGARERAREAEEMRKAIEASLLDRGEVDEDEEMADPDDPQDFDFAAASRSYDDEDAELQAALQASLGAIPAGWEIPQPQIVKRASQREAERQAEVSQASASATPPETTPVVDPASKDEEEEEEAPVEELSPGKLSSI